MIEFYMIDKILKSHPSFHFAQEIADICRPLHLLDIHYFAHVNIDSKKQFSAISSDPFFAEHYLKNHYYNADIHMADKNLGNQVLWDFVQLRGQSLKMHSEAREFGIKHTFTLIQKNNQNGTDYYHFASQVSDNSINQRYWVNQDLLKIFILHFKEKVTQSKYLSNAYHLKIKTSQNLSSYIVDEKTIVTPDMKSEFIKKINWKKTEAAHFFILDPQLSQMLTQREQECLYFYVLGKSPKEMSAILFISKRTIEQYLENIKIKLNVRTKSELIESVIHRFYIYSSKS